MYKKIISRCIALLASLSLALAFTGCDEDFWEDDSYSDNTGSIKTTTNNEKSRDYYSNPTNSQSMTIMIYMCGSDLESQNGAASADITEMLGADIDENINVIIQTGGASQWTDYGIRDDVNQIYRINNGELELLQDLPLTDMADGKTLTDFVNYCKSNYTADRYGLIMWDHGGGSIDGFGWDENFQDNMMRLYDMDTAIGNSGVKFDFIGFDACLMATIETALMAEKHSDYLIASEETEPACGWYYTDWLSNISANTETTEIGKLIIDDFVDHASEETWFGDATLSIVDLTEVGSVYRNLCEFANEASDELAEKNYAYISKGRSETKGFADDEIDHIDMLDLANNINLPESEQLVSSIDDCVKYKASSWLMEDVGGLSVYFPYYELDYFDSMLSVYTQLNVDSEYSSFIRDFATIMVGGQQNKSASKGYTSPIDAIMTDEVQTTEQSENYDWYEDSEAQDYESYYQENAFDGESLEVIQDGDKFILPVSDEQWDMISQINCQVYYDDGEGYIDFGYDNIYESDEDGNLIMDFDGYWAGINGQTVPFYSISEEKISDDKWKSYGYSPATLNDETDIEIIIAWDNENPEGYIAGYRYAYGETSLSAKGLMQFREGDKIDFYCDYYEYDGSYNDEYYIGETLTVGKDGLKVDYIAMYGTFVFTYMITDIYGNNFWTEALKVTFDSEQFQPIT